MTDALAALGVLAVVSSSSMSAPVSAFVIISLGLAMAIPEAWQGRAWLRHFATIGPLTLFTVQGARLLSGSPALDISVEFAALLQVIRISTRKGAAHDQQIIVIALLHFVTGTVLGGGIAYGLCFIGFLIVAPAALVLSHLRREVEGNYRQGARDRTGLPVDVPRILRSRRVVGRGFLAMTGLLSVPIFVFTGALFIMFPRVGLSLLLLAHPQRGRMVGFSDRVDLGEVGVLRNDPSIALRFEVPDLADPPPARITLRLRGTAFDRYDGRRWERTQPAHTLADGTELLNIARPPAPSDRRVTFDLEPIEPPVLFLPPRTVAVHVGTQQQAALGDPLLLTRGPENEIRYRGSESHGLRYEAYIAGDRDLLTESLPSADRQRYLEVPQDTPERDRALAHEWADGQPSQYLKAKAIEEHLKKDFTYDTGSPSGGKPQPVDHFLFESKRGHCEFFSTALALMLREVGIPSRNVTGFVGGTYNRFGRYYAVREGDAHSWVEAHLEEPVSGWITLDATPTSGAQPLQATTGPYVYMRDLLEALSQRWNHDVLSYDLKTQVRAFDGASRAYEKARAKAGLHRGTLERLTRAPNVATFTAAMVVAAYAFWKRRHRARRARQPAQSSEAPNLVLEAATSLYRTLEAAMAAQGVARTPCVPPLRHAEKLKEREHPLAMDVFVLTEYYLRARFGGVPISEEATRAFEKKVNEIRTYPALPQETAEDI